MPAKVYIALALLVLFGALATGNPFLPRPARAGLPADDGVRLLSLRTGHAAGRAAGLAAVALPCPVPELQAQVVDVRFDADGEPSSSMPTASRAGSCGTAGCCGRTR